MKEWDMAEGWTRRQAAVALATTVAFARAARAESLPRMVVTKDPSCGCCAGWTEHVRAAGFPVEVVETESLNRVKRRLGVPQDLAGCHTAEVGGYVVEGHVPATAIRRLLDEKPAAIGLAVPGMPVGSPGMEVEGSPPETYEVVLFGPSGRRRFARFEGAREI
jgi:hypothetical protein